MIEFCSVRKLKVWDVPPGRMKQASLLCASCRDASLTGMQAKAVRNS
ncbi:MAG: hypothetical protein LBR26_06235 [Prevotella sp.]|nr:hypothetical protein [Prevotella sp.]